MAKKQQIKTYIIYNVCEGLIFSWYREKFTTVTANGLKEDWREPGLCGPKHRSPFVITYSSTTLWASWRAAVQDCTELLN